VRAGLVAAAIGSHHGVRTNADAARSTYRTGAGKRKPSAARDARYASQAQNDQGPIAVEQRKTNLALLIRDVTRSRSAVSVPVLDQDTPPARPAMRSPGMTYRAQTAEARLAFWPNTTLTGYRTASAAPHMDDKLLHSRRSAEKVAVLILGLDNFKTVNDALGHGIGDKLLRASPSACVRCCAMKIRWPVSTPTNCIIRAG